MGELVTRFAPSPTGPLHLGHAFSALVAHDMARAAGGRFLLRIEDIDRSRSRPEWERQLVDDLHWLGITWDAPPLRQSDNLPAYAAALNRLWARGLIYSCRCSRRDIEAALSAPQEGAEPPTGPDGLIYPGTCRPAPGFVPAGPRPEGANLRLNMRAAMRETGDLAYTETGIGPGGQTGEIRIPAAAMIAGTGDVVVARRDMGTSYHLSVVFDDAAQGVTHVMRGADLTEATRIHVALQRLLDLPAPVYHHHRLIRDEAGKRLAKRDDALALARYRAEGATPNDIRRMVGLAQVPGPKAG